MAGRRIVWSLLPAAFAAQGIGAQDVVVPARYDATEAPGNAFWALSPFASRQT